VLISVADPKVAKSLREAAQAEGLRVNFCLSAEGVRTLFARDPPSLAIIDLNIARHDNEGICEAIREMKENEPPVVAVAEQEDEADGIMDWLITPFTDSYARTKIRAWVLREACRWARAAVPKDGARRASDPG
jgi:DNA-binding response OmpR family regulator